MRFHGGRNGYNRVHGDEITQDPPENEELESPLPIDPPGYENVEIEEPETPQLSGDSPIEQMDLEELLVDTEEEGRLFTKMLRFRDRFSYNVILPVRRRIVDPLAQISKLISEKIDFYLNKVGNPLILRRFFYVFLMSGIAYMVMSSGLMPTERSTGTKGMFSDFEILMQYTESAVDLSKLETDLQYISSMPHMSGTQGDWAIREYVKESFVNNKLKIIGEGRYKAYSNYFDEASLKAYNGAEEIDFQMTEENFNPSCANGDIKNFTLIYGNMGSAEDLKRLKDNGLLEDEYVLLVHYGKVVSEQMLLAEKFNARGVLFITDPYNEDKDVIQRKSVAIHQYYTGDALSPGWFGDLLPEIDREESKGLPHIPSLPLSWNQGSKLISMLEKDGVNWQGDKFSGRPGSSSVRLDMKVNTAIRPDHPVQNVIGKIEGREQNDKGIFIAASRTNGINGTAYPAFGTALLLSLIQSFQELKYKFGWKPLRNIYFVSFGGTEFNYAGATEFVEQQLISIKDEIYSFLDISQLGLEKGSKKIGVQAHPLLNTFYKDNNDFSGLELSIRNVAQYGDWTPFLANGIPVSVFSSPTIEESKPPIDTSRDVFENIASLLENSEMREMASDILLFIFKTSLKLVDTPLLPFDILSYVHVLREAFMNITTKYPKKFNINKALKALSNWEAIGAEWHAWSEGWKNIVYTRDEGLEPSLLSVHRWTWNKKLSNIVRRQCIAAGLPQRPFYKNVIFGPALWSQESETESWTFPGVRDAISTDNWDVAQQEMDAVIRMLEQSAALFLEETTDVGN